MAPLIVRKWSLLLERLSWAFSRVGILAPLAWGMLIAIYFHMIKLSRSQLVLIFVLGLSFSAQSASIGGTGTEDCRNPESTDGQQLCAEKAYDMSNKILNDLYQIMMQRMHSKVADDMARMKTHPDDGISEDMLRKDNETENRLITAQRAWTQFRNANCYLVAASISTGSGEGTENIKCLNQMTLTRARDLRVISDNLFVR